MVTNMNKKFIIEYKLEELSEMLGDETFFRVNRTFIVNINAIDDVIVYSNSRLKVCPKISTTKEIVVSREKVSEFKEWLAGS